MYQSTYYNCARQSKLIIYLENNFNLEINLGSETPYNIYVVWFHAAFKFQLLPQIFPILCYFENNI